MNAIAPAFIETEMIAGNPQAWPERIPAGRFGTAEEVAEAVGTHNAHPYENPTGVRCRSFGARYGEQAKR